MRRPVRRGGDRRAGLAAGAAVDLGQLGQRRALGGRAACRPEKFALAGLSLGGMLAVEIMQIAAERVTKLALLDTGMRSQNEAERAIRRARIRLANEGHFELVLGLQMSRFIPAYRLPDKTLVDEVMAMCGEIGVEIYKRQEELAAVRADRRPDLPKIKCPTIVVCGRDDAATPLFLSEEMAAAIKGSELIVIEQCGHLVTMEKPEETNAILKRWLSTPSSERGEGPTRDHGLSYPHDLLVAQLSASLAAEAGHLAQHLIGVLAQRRRRARVVDRRVGEVVVRADDRHLARPWLCL